MALLNTVKCETDSKENLPTVLKPRATVKHRKISRFKAFSFLVPFFCSKNKQTDKQTSKMKE